MTQRVKINTIRDFALLPKSGQEEINASSPRFQQIVVELSENLPEASRLARKPAAGTDAAMAGQGLVKIGPLEVADTDIMPVIDDKDTSLPRVVKYLQKISRFLRPDHPMAIQLQEYINQMRDPSSRPSRLFIMIDGLKPGVFAINDIIIVNLALIRRLDMIDELLALLAQSQDKARHSQSMYAD